MTDAERLNEILIKVSTIEVLMGERCVKNEKIIQSIKDRISKLEKWQSMVIGIGIVVGTIASTFLNKIMGS